MILVNEPRGYRVCLECHETFADGDERTWLQRHAACEANEKPVAA